MRLAAIDIGSNAIRLLIEEIFTVDNKNYVRKISLTRVPVRLGEDVFTLGEISTKKINQLVLTMEAFWNLMDVHEVTDFRACATSAMREATNGKAVAELIRLKSRVNIDIISGQEEASLLFSNFRDLRYIKPEENYLYIDLGGGSTEITLIEKGERTAAKSFKLGTVRSLNANNLDNIWLEIEEWMAALDLKSKELIGIGTGGNINRLHKESGLKSVETLSYKDLEATVNYLSGYSYEERISKLRLKPDRADVIVPAGLIYMRIMKLSGVSEVKVPKVGLSDGIILELYKNWEKKIE